VPEADSKVLEMPYAVGVSVFWLRLKKKERVFLVYAPFLDYFY